MLKAAPSWTSCKYQLEELLNDPSFLKTIDLVTKEVMRSWNVPYNVAHGFVLSAVGEPRTLTSIHRAWILMKETGEKPGLAKVIVRRRVIDLLRKDARPNNHCSLPVTVDAIDTGRTPAFNELVQRNPRAQLELRQIIQMVRGALTCFASQGQIQERQAKLLQRYTLDEVNYPELSVELACSESALRVRVHKAMLALRRHIRECHSELEDLLDCDRPRATLAQVMT